MSRPIIELRDVARAIAAGELDRRPTLAAPGEVGDLALALHRMTEQLASRLSALESEDALLNAVIESLDEGIIAVNPRGETVRLNESARRLLGARRRRFPSRWISCRKSDSCATRCAAAMNGVATEPSELALGDRTLLITARPLPDGGAVLAVMDLTTRRRLETIRRDFVANVSHELKTPLTVIGGFAETLRDADLPAEDRQRFLADHRVEHATHAAHRRRPARPVAIRIGKLGSEHRLERPRRHRQRRVHRGAPHPPKRRDSRSRSRRTDRRVDADPTALRQILGNLVENAVRHTARGSITVSAEPGRTAAWT